MTVPPATTTPDPPRPIPRAAAVEEMFQRGVRLQRGGQTEEAVRTYALALALKPDEARVANNLAVALRALGRRDAAEILYRRVLAVSPDTASAYVNHGNVLRDLGRLDDAVARHRRALELEPGTRGALYGLGLCFRDMKRLKESVTALEQVVALTPEDPEANWDLAQSLLCAGDYRRGFEQYEWRWRLAGVTRPDYGLPEWDGQPLAGRRLLLYGEQGFGDVVQFARFIPLALGTGKEKSEDEAGTVALRLRAELVPLIEGQIPGVVEVLPREVPAGSGCDVQAPLLSLPRVLGLDRIDVPPSPYLRPPARTPHLPARPPEARRQIGLCWQGSPTQKNDRNRSLPFSALLPLLARPDIAFVSLQKGPAAREPEEQGLGPLIPSLDAHLTDFADTAATIAALDLVITADTSVLHVAGALGKPVWILLSTFHDWRFDAEDSIAIWYPQARVFKQRTPGDWGEVVARIAEALEEEITAQPAGTPA